MAYNPFIAQGNSLQGSMGTGLQGSSGGFLQSSYNPIQMPNVTLQGTPIATAQQKPQTYGNPAATSPARTQYVNDLSSRYGQYNLNGNPTIYDKSTNTPFSNQQDFYASAGVNSFNGLKFDMGYTPPSTMATSGKTGSTYNTGVDISQLTDLGSTQPKSVADPYADFKSAYTGYADSLKASDKVSAARKAYLDYTTNLQQSIKGFEGQGRGIPVSLIRGQQEKLYNQGQLEAQRLQGDVAIAQDEQKSTTESKKAILDFEKSLLDLTKPISLDANNQLVQLDPKTGQYKQIVAPQATLEKPIAVGGDLVQYNPQTRQYEAVYKGDGLDNEYKKLQIEKLRQDIAGGGDSNKVLTPTEAQLLGVPYGTTAGQAIQQGITPTKPLTDAQSQSAGYALRVKQAGDNIDSLVDTIVSMPYLTFEAQRRLPSNFQTNEFRAYDQAARNLINAILRKESGAAIQQTEFENAYQQYLPRSGDDAKTLAWKKQNREAKLSGLIQESGSGYQQLSGGGGSSGGNNPNDPLGLGFNTVGKTSASTPYLKTLGVITGENGSSLWSYGLDVDLKKGDPVKSPATGTVIAVGTNGGFGNQIKIRTVDGREIWLSHLDSMNVKKGQTVSAGQLIALGGNTGNVIPGKGGDGSHLDITMKDKNGKLLTAPQVKQFLSSVYV